MNPFFTNFKKDLFVQQSGGAERRLSQMTTRDSVGAGAIQVLRWCLPCRWQLSKCLGHLPQAIRPSFPGHQLGPAQEWCNWDMSQFLHEMPVLQTTLLYLLYHSASSWIFTFKNPPVDTDKACMQVCFHLFWGVIFYSPFLLS